MRSEKTFRYRCRRRRRHRFAALFFSAFKWVTVDCEPHGIGGGGADEQVRRERQDTGRIEGTRHANPSSRCQQPTLYTHTRPGTDRVRTLHRGEHAQRTTCREKEGGRETERTREGHVERKWRYGEGRRRRKGIEIDISSF